VSGALLILILCGYGGYELYSVSGERASLEVENESLKVDLLNANVANDRLSQELRDQLYIVESFQGQISRIGSVVGDLEKLKNTDDELLRKYSKVYFLSENYIPSKLSYISVGYLLNKEAKLQIHTDVSRYLERLLDAARSDGVDILVASAYRSFDTQEVLKSNYKVTYGAGTANQFSAEQGYSEHQLGTTVDFTTPGVGAVFSRFESDPAYLWLLDNAHKYGFALSYPKNNSYYIFEPWHWRFVGVELATKLHSDGKYFYDLDQREIDKYLIKLFD
jgi:LAS superfamily LD-carboxypeptidase LdcB